MSAVSTKPKGYDEYTRLYSLINEDLFGQLNNSIYPSSPEAISSFQSTLIAMKRILVCPEVINKFVYSFVGSYINKIMFVTGKELFDADTSKLTRIRFTVPVIVFDCDKINIQAVNIYEQRTELSISELEFLVNGCFNKISLEKIIHCFVIGIPLKVKNTCFVYSKIGFQPISTQNKILCCFSEQKNKRPVARNLFSNVVYTEENFLPGNLEQINLQKIHVSELVGSLSKSNTMTYNGFTDNLEYIACCINKFYSQEIKKSTEISTALTNDIIKLGGFDETLIKLRDSQKERKKQLQKEANRIGELLCSILNKSYELSDILGDRFVVGMNMITSIKNNIYLTFFHYVETNDFANAAKFLSKIHRMDEKNYSILSKYATFMQNKMDEVNAVEEFSTDNLNTENNEWYVAKAILAMTDILKPPKSGLEKLVYAVNSPKFLTLGKEYYSKALFMNSNYVEYLKKSLDLGYYPAGEKLYELYEQGDKRVNLVYLATNLIPEACMLMAEEEINKQKSTVRNKGKKYRKSLSDRDMVYYKLAASQGYCPAIGKIVDIIFNERFSQLVQIRQEEKTLDKYSTMQKNGRAICPLCQYLISKKYDSMHYQEILGIVLFCLNEDTSEAMRLLSGINTAQANFCKGVMYEFGEGTAIDYDEAILHYEKAPSFSYSSHCLERVRSKKAVGERRVAQASSYHSASSYHHSSSSSSYSDGFCFITTAACAALNAGDDCECLNILRNFRDEHIADTDEGKQLILEYYKIAPGIVDILNELPDSESEYLFLWNNFIKPSCEEIGNHNWNEAEIIYINMVKSLCERFGIAVDEDISKKYKIGCN